jgi:glycogen debranching enzyme
VHEFLERVAGDRTIMSEAQRATLHSAIRGIVDGYAAGTRFGIRMDDDGLLAAGVAGVQLTWMDAKVGDRVITPRIGKPVEIQALWVNALLAAGRLDASRLADAKRATASFVRRFWIAERGHLADVVDVDHVPGTRDETFRPNQIFAIGGLPVPLLAGEQARAVVNAVEARLMTPLGLRSLASDEPGYAPRYEGDSSARDSVYHQGTVWPWLAGPFVEAWLRVRRPTAAAKREARQRFVQPLIEHLAGSGLGHVSEIADAEAPFTPKGCPFQAWSLGELLRLDRTILAETRATTRHKAPATASTRASAARA